jgi:hypothetical protein
MYVRPPIPNFIEILELVSEIDICGRTDGHALTSRYAFHLGTWCSKYCINLKHSIQPPTDPIRKLLSVLGHELPLTLMGSIPVG